MNATGGMGPTGGAGGTPVVGPRGPPFTEAQLKSLHNIPRITAALSVMGSCLVLYMVLKSSLHGLRRPQNRLLFAISIADIPFSLMFVLGTIMMPSFLPIDGSFGNTTTCEVQGFFLQTGYAQPLYNAFLMVYYALTVCAGLQDEFISKWIEPFFHSFTILFALGTASAGVALDLFNPSPVGRCAINAFPMGCVENPNLVCQRGASHREYKWAFNLGPTLVALSVMFLALATLAIFVGMQERAALRKSRHRSAVGFHSAVERRPIWGNQVVNRALLYAFVFLNTYSWITVANMIRVVAHTPPPYWLVLTGNILQPSQGFFNWILYVYPRYSAVRRSYKDWPWWRVFFHATNRGTLELPRNRRLSRGSWSIEQSGGPAGSILRTESSRMSSTETVGVTFAVPAKEGTTETIDTTMIEDTSGEGDANPESSSEEENGQDCL